MSVNLHWDMPGLFWDSDATWDGTQPVNKPTVKSMKTKCIINFAPYRNDALGPVGHIIHEEMSANATVFTDPPVSMATLLTQLNSYDQKLTAKIIGSPADTLAFNVQRAVVEDSLRLLGLYVNQIANGDPTIVMQSGFPFYTTGRTVNTNPPAAPVAVRVEQGPTSGSMLVRFKTDRNPSMNEVEVNLVDPINENDWTKSGTYQSGRVTLSGLPPGTLVWVRVRTLGLKSVVSDWSDVAQLRVV